MIFIRPSLLAVILLVLLCVVSAMGGCSEKHRFFHAENTQTGCLSFRKPKTLMDCCNAKDPMQMVYTSMTGQTRGIYHTYNGCKVLCYNEKKGRFKLHRPKHCRNRHRHHHNRRRRRRRGGHHAPRRSSTACHLTLADLGPLPPHLKCQLHESMAHAGHFYISARNDSMFLAVRNGKAQKLFSREDLNGVVSVRERKEKYRRFIIMTDENMERISHRCETS